MTPTLTPVPSPPLGEASADVRTAAVELLRFLRAAEFAVSARDGRVYISPRERLSPAEVAQVVALKPELLALLAEEQWKQCQVCLHHVDSGQPADVWRFCGVKICPYRGGQKR